MSDRSRRAHRAMPPQARQTVLTCLAVGACLAVAYLLLWLLDDQYTPSRLTSGYLRFSSFWVSPLIAVLCYRRGWSLKAAYGLGVAVFIAFFLLATVIQHGDLSLRRPVLTVVLGAFVASPVLLFLRSFNKPRSRNPDPPHDAAYRGV